MATQIRGLWLVKINPSYRDPQSYLSYTFYFKKVCFLLVYCQESDQIPHTNIQHLKIRFFWLSHHINKTELFTCLLTVCPLDNRTTGLGITFSRQPPVCLPHGASVEDWVLRALNVLRLQKYPDISVCSIQPPIYFETKTVIWCSYSRTSDAVWRQFL